MSVKYYKSPKGWSWIVYDSKKLEFARCSRSYSRLSDAKRAFQKLDSLF